MSARPTVSVIVPFAGSPAKLEELMRRLGVLELQPGDEVIVADNRPVGAAEAVAGAIRVIAAAGMCSPGFARNRAAATATGDWLVMIDADTEPTATLVDAYFDPLPRPTTAVLAGGIVDRAVPGSGLAARRSAERAQMDQRVTLERGTWSYAQSANIAVNREAFARVGGFDEEARAGEDADLCFRMTRSGWQLEARPAAVVAHDSRATVPALLAQLAQHGAGAAWVERRYPGAFPPPTVRAFAGRVARHLLTAALAGVRGRREAALGELLAIAEAGAFEVGRRLSNRPRRVMYE